MNRNVILSEAKDLLLSFAVDESGSFVAELLRMTGVDCAPQDDMIES